MKEFGVRVCSGRDLILKDFRGELLDLAQLLSMSGHCFNNNNIFKIILSEADYHRTVNKLYFWVEILVFFTSSYYNKQALNISLMLLFTEMLLKMDTNTRN